MGDDRPQQRQPWLIERIPTYLDLANEADQFRVVLGFRPIDNTLYDVAHFNARVQEFYAKPELPPRRRAQTIRAFGDQLVVYHSVLPFSEAERHWLGGVFASAGSDLTQKYAEDEGSYVAGMELLNESITELVVAGVRQTVTGGDLRQRWLDWQHQAGKYEGQNTRGLARTALSGIAGVLNPDRAVRD